MYRIGNEEVEAVRRLFASGQVFRYGKATECDRFEKRFAELLGVRYVRMCNSGTSGLIAALIGMCLPIPIWPRPWPSWRSELSPDVDDSLTLCPTDTERKITRRTKAIMPVHMVGLCCDMESLTALARKERVLICEDVCQAVGGSYKGKRLGSFGLASGFSFNYYKNITAGEGGCFATDREDVYKRGSVAVDPCSYYWAKEDEKIDMHGRFTAWNFRATEVAGAILNVQLNYLDEMLCRMRKQKAAVTSAGVENGLRSIVNHSPEWECGSHAGFLFESEPKARRFVKLLAENGIGSFRPIDTGRHVYTNWDPIISKQASHHPALNPYLLKENRDAEAEYTPRTCARSLDILKRAVLISMHPYWPEGRLEQVIAGVARAARAMRPRSSVRKARTAKRA
jgi:dTDP-4-amino-4,6-dideoxygalactose transaminase